MILIECKINQRHYFKDERGLIQGDYVKYHVNGVVHIAGKYVNGMVHGLYQVWNECGSICEQVQYQHNARNGEYKLFSQNGMALIYHKWYEHDKPMLDFLKGDEYPITPEAILNFKLKHEGEFI